MKFADVKGTVARSLGRAPNLQYICVGLDVENADIVMQDTNTLEALHFLTKHSVACSLFLATQSTVDPFVSLSHNLDIFRNRGSVQHSQAGSRVVICKDVVCTGELLSNRCTDFLSFCSHLGREMKFNLPRETRIDFDFGSELLIDSFQAAVAKSRTDTVITFKLYRNDIEVYSVALAGQLNSINTVADRAAITFESPVQLVSTASITNPRFVTKQYVEYNEEVKSILIIRLDTVATPTRWSPQIACVHYDLNDVDLVTNMTNQLESTFPIMIGLEAR